MTALPIPSGPTNREIIDRAYQVLGVSDAMFGRTEEEYASALLPLGGMMLEPPFNLLGYDGYDGGLKVEEESGIDRQWLEAVAYGLAERIGPTIGKTLSPNAEKVKNRLLARITATFAVVPSMEFAAGTPRGSGNRAFSRLGSVFFTGEG